jgi:hypothetical protein
MSYQKVGDSGGYGAATESGMEGFGAAVSSQVGTTYGGSDGGWVKGNQNTILAIVGGLLFVSGIYMLWPAAGASEYDANSIDARLSNIPGYDPSRASSGLDSSDEETAEAATSYLKKPLKKQAQKDFQVPDSPNAQFVATSSVVLSSVRKSMIAQAITGWIEAPNNDVAVRKVVRMLSQCSSEEINNMRSDSANELGKDGASVLKRYAADRKDFLDETVPVLRKLLTTKQHNRLQHKLNTMLPGQRADLYAAAKEKFPNDSTMLKQMIDSRAADTASFQSSIAQDLSHSSYGNLNVMSLNQMYEVESAATAAGDASTASSIEAVIQTRTGQTQQQLRPVTAYLADKGTLPKQIQNVNSKVLKDFLALVHVKQESNKLKLDLAIQQHKPSTVVKQISGWLDGNQDCRNAIVAFMDRKPVPKEDYYNSPVIRQRQRDYNAALKQQQIESPNLQYMGSDAPPPPPPMQQDNSRFVASPPPPPQPQDNSRFLAYEPHPKTAAETQGSMASPAPPPSDEQQECANKDVSCENWAKKGECDKNTAYMQKMCCRSCKEKEESSSGGFFGRRLLRLRGK